MAVFTFLITIKIKFMTIFPINITQSAFPVSDYCSMYFFLVNPVPLILGILIDTLLQWDLSFKEFS